jgi:putative ABC transport system substrate-binding protein
VAEQYDRFPGQVAELIGMNVDVLVASIRPAAIAAQRATTTIPIVFVAVADPVESGLVKSLDRPGANITGLSTMSIELGAKRLEIIKEALPGLSRVALLVNATDQDLANRFIRDNHQAAGTLGIDLVPIEVREPGDLESAFANAREQRVHAVVPVIDAMFFNQRELLGKLGLKYRLPMMVHTIDMVASGPLMGFGPNSNTLFRRAPALVDKILRGTKPADVPVEMPTHFELRINLKTAKALGHAIPAALLARADILFE